MDRYEVGAIVPAHDTKPRVEVTTDDDHFFIELRRICRANHWQVIRVVNLYDYEVRYYRFTMQQVWYYAQYKRWMTLEEYNQRKNNN